MKQNVKHGGWRVAAIEKRDYPEKAGFFSEIKEFLSPDNALIGTEYPDVMYILYGEDINVPEVAFPDSDAAGICYVASTTDTDPETCSLVPSSHVPEELRELVEKNLPR